jgi:hypothetical protein
MKISLDPSRRRPLDRSFARSCFIANITFPGLGSCMAGKKSGYIQMLLVGTGFVFGIYWSVFVLLTFFKEIFTAAEYPDFVERFVIFWRVITGTKLQAFETAVILTIIAYLWAFGTNVLIFRSMKKNEPPACY